MLVRSRYGSRRSILAALVAVLALTVPVGAPLVPRSLAAAVMPPAALPSSSDTASSPAAPTLLPAPIDPKAALLETLLEPLIADCPGLLSLEVRAPSEGWRVQHGSSRVVKAASVIKLPILCAIHAFWERGEASPEETMFLAEADRTGGSGSLERESCARPRPIRELVERMIVESDNTATNALIRRFGREALDAEFRRMGLNGTRLERRILEKGGDNPATAEEISAILAALAGHPGGVTLALSEDSRREIIGLLERTENRRRLGRYLPADAQLAHKTGTLSGIVHDAGIVETPSGPIIITALVERAGNRSRVEEWLGRLGRLVYNSLQEN